MSEISTWLGADVRYWILPEDHGSWSLHLRCLQRGSCGNHDVAGLRIDGRGLQSSFGECIFPNTVAFAMKAHMIHMICIWFWKPFTVSELNAKSWFSKHLETIRRVFVSKWGKVQFAAGRGVSWGKKEKQSHCLQEIGDPCNAFSPGFLQWTCQHVNWPSLLEA